MVPGREAEKAQQTTIFDRALKTGSFGRLPGGPEAESYRSAPSPRRLNFSKLALRLKCGPRYLYTHEARLTTSRPDF